ncbi:MAG: protein kinase [Chloroflexi bacterium]|nr:protein kinase [Chloroflexota bacterium]
MTDLSGQYLGRYYLSERLGEGGMAVVYKAYDTRLERDVAIKIIRSGAFPPDALGEVLKRFEREAKSLAKLSHPNIVKVHDYGEHEGSPFLVMEYLPGGTLKNILGKLVPWQDAVRLILPVARGVAYAHQRGILHRDIKPANVLITESGEPMLSDFGIAKLFEGDQTTALTGSGMAIGTPEYMAPEQWTGVTSPQSDLYSLGIMLYELVAGRKPYVADTPAAILIKQATEPLPNPRKFAVDLPESLELVLIKMLAREPQDRYKDVKAFISALESLYVSVPVVSSLPSEQKHVEETYKIPSQFSGETIPAGDVVVSPMIKESLLPPTTVSKIPSSIKFSSKGMGWLIGLVVIALIIWLGSPLIEKWFSPAPLSMATVTIIATETKPVIPTLVSLSFTPSPTELPIIQPTQTPTNTPVSTPSPSETVSTMTLGEWVFWTNYRCTGPYASDALSIIFTVNFRADGTYTRGNETDLWKDGKIETGPGETQGSWTVVGDKVTLLMYGDYRYVGKINENKMEQGIRYKFRDGVWLQDSTCWSATLK